LPSIIDPSSASDDGTIGRSSTVAKTIASSVSVRTVATCVPVGIRTTSGCGADSQNVTCERAAVGGKRLTPISSRNFT
jgi:hypothetical protein